MWRKGENDDMFNQFYMDTNVYIARFKSDDPYHAQSRSIIRSLERGEIQAETSVFTLLEVLIGSFSVEPKIGPLPELVVIVSTVRCDPSFA